MVISRENLSNAWQRQRYVGYANYVERGSDEDIKRFYNKGNILSVLGDNEFREARKSENESLDIAQLQKALEDKPPIAEIVERVAKVLKCHTSELTQKVSGRRNSTPRRAFAIYAACQYSDASRRDVAAYFNLSHSGSVSTPVTRVRKQIEEGEWKREVLKLEKGLIIVKLACPLISSYFFQSGKNAAQVFIGKNTKRKRLTQRQANVF